VRGVRLAAIVVAFAVGGAATAIATASSSRASRTTRDYMFVGGHGVLRLPQGKAGRVTVIATGAVHTNGFDKDIGLMPVVLRNNSQGPVADIKVTTTVYVGGKRVATGADAGFLPYRVPRGGLAMGSVVFERSVPSSARFSFQATAIPLSQLRFAANQDMGIVRTRLEGWRIVGVARNVSKKTIDGSVTVVATCFDGKGRLTGQETGGPNGESIVRPGGRVSFEVDLTTGIPHPPACAHWLVASSAIKRIPGPPPPPP
jgi:hypothetical protein